MADLESNVKLMKNAREYIVGVLVKAGVEITDAGILVDEDKPRADIGLRIDGAPFGIQIRFRHDG